jgi:hypothetical protein
MLRAIDIRITRWHTENLTICYPKEISLKSKLLKLALGCLVIMSFFAASCDPEITTNTTTTGSTLAGDPDWWKKQPDLALEQSKIKDTIAGLESALAAQDVQKAMEFFAEEERDKYAEILSAYPDVMSDLAEDLKKATITYLSPDDDGTLLRIAEYSIPVDGKNTVSIVFIKVDGKWLLKTL